MTTELAIIKPITVTPAMLLSSSVPEDDYPEWDAGTTYSGGDRVILAAQHSVYESLIDANTNKPPLSNLVSAWVRVGPTNRWKAFDRSNSSQTKQANEIDYEIEPGYAVSSLALLNLANLHKVTVTMDDPTFGEVYSREIDVTPLPPEPSWYAWFFGQREEVKQITLRDLPTYPQAVLTVEIDGGADLAVGVLMLGQERRTGAKVLAGASAGIQDYSRKEADEFGDVILVERAYAKRATLLLFLDNDDIDAFYELLAEIRATPCLFIAGKRRMLTIYGFYKEFDILINYSRNSDATIEIEGLT